MHLIVVRMKLYLEMELLEAQFTLKRFLVINAVMLFKSAKVPESFPADITLMIAAFFIMSFSYMIEQG